ncbi:MAG: hypothetical protein ACRCX2_20355 [Paraclostridium sp.]
MDSYNSINKDNRFQLDIPMGLQWKKVLEEVEEVNCEIGVLESGKLYFRAGGNLDNLINELLDIKLATDNLINRLEDEYGRPKVKEACLDWDKKLKYYREVKYKEEV